MDRPSFARTKIQPPRPRAVSLIERPALDARLAEALCSHRLVLVCAAAGYGKTAALAAQFARRSALPAGTALAWISVDEGDDLHRLLDCIVAALEPFDPPWRTAPEALVSAVGDASRAARRSIAGELINTLDACDVPRGVIVLDDAHRIDDPAVFEFLDLMLERLTPRWTLAIASRVPPPLALARLRALGELAEFRQHDLQFDRAEAHRLAAAAGLDAASADAMLERTQGWAVGLRLAVNAQRSGAGGIANVDRHMFEFLAAEVLDQLAPELRDFLLRTSVLPELTATKGAAVSGNPRAGMLLEQIESQGLFVTTLDETERTLRLHDLFRGALEHRLARERPDELPELLKRAAACETDPTRVVALLLRAGELDRAARVLLDHGLALLTEGALASVARLLEQFPAGYAAQSPLLQQLRGLFGWAHWDFAAMLAAMQRAEAGYRAQGDDEGVRLAQAYQSIALIPLGRATESSARLGTLRREALGTETRVIVLVACLWHAIELGSIQRVGPLLDELMDCLEPSSDLSLWYRAHPVARCNGLPGTARALERYVEGTLRLTEGKPMPLRASAFLQRGWRAAWDGRLDDAEDALRLAQGDAQWLGHPPSLKSQICLFNATLRTLRGEREAALAAARALVDDAPRGYGEWAIWMLLFHAARVAAACEDLPALRGYAERLRNSRGGLPRSIAGNLAWLEGHAAQAVTMWTDALSDEGRLDRLGHAIETRMRLAGAHVARGRRADAARVLQPVFERVDAYAGVGGVLFARAALPALGGAAWGDELGAPERARLRAWLDLAEQRGAAPPASPARPAGAGSTVASCELSARELEVLERIAAGDSNKLIARAFDLSPHTVKRHVANILDKLGVASRGQAAAWHRARGRA
jgi:LuxR family maltose regulon positive regulatory protein